MFIQPILAALLASQLALGAGVVRRGPGPVPVPGAGTGAGAGYAPNAGSNNLQGTNGTDPSTASPDDAPVDDPSLYAQDPLVSPYQDKCLTNDDLMTCARKMASSWSIQSSNMGNPYTVYVPVNLGDAPEKKGFILAEIRIAAKNCTLSQPYIASMSPTFVCNTNMCREMMSLTTTIRQTNQYGQSVKVGASGGAFFFSANADVGTNTNWEGGSDIQETKSTEYVMVRGDICAPASIQYYVECTTILQSTYQIWPWISLDINNNYTEDISCDKLDQYPAALNSDLKLFCNNQESPENLKLDLPSGATTNKPWTLQGCLTTGN